MIYPVHITDDAEDEMAGALSRNTKILCLMKIFLEETDEDHGLTMPQIISKLEAYGITANRKTVYSDISDLSDFGIDIIGEKTGREYIYHAVGRTFELAELKLLVDSVQAAKFISEKKSRELIGKLGTLASIHEARQLSRQVLISGRVKTMNESVYYGVDKLHQAINENRQITFQYFQWNMDKEAELRHGGRTYTASPWSLIWDDEYYYLVAYDEEAEKIKHYRVDKMVGIEQTDAPRSGSEEFGRMDVSTYSKQLFGMFGGEVRKVTLECRKEAAGIIIDRFGKDVIMQKTDDEHFICVVDVAVSKQFEGWLFSLSDIIKITAPADVADAVKKDALSFASRF